MEKASLDTKEVLWIIDALLDSCDELAAREYVWLSEARGLIAQANNSLLGRGA